MLLLDNTRLLATLLLAWLAISPCWAFPGKDPITPLKQSGIHHQSVSPGGAPGKTAHFPGAGKFVQWMNEVSIEKWDLASQTKGGVEKWVQFELEFALKKELRIPFGYKCREDAVYKDNSNLADLVFDPDAMKSSTRTGGIIAELKIESHSYRGATFSKAVKADIDKLRSDVKDKFANYDKSVFAIAWNPATHSALESRDPISAGSMSGYPEPDIILTTRAWTVGKNQFQVKLYEFSLDRTPKGGDISTSMSDLSLGGDIDSKKGDKDRKKSDKQKSVH